MDDFDDYFTDDIVLDEQTLAVLDQEEQKYLIQNAAPQVVSPATKRQKTTHEWKPGFAIRGTAASDELEDLPEISVYGDGSYGVHLGARNIGGTSYNVLDGISSDPTPHPRGRVDPAASHLANSSAGPSRVSRHPSQRPPPSGYQPFPLQNRSQQRQRQLAHGRSFRTTHQSSLVASVASQRVPVPLSHTSKDESSGSQQFGVPAEDLRQQLEELHKENLRVQTALQEAMNVKLAKEGEVSILRKGIERTAQDHAAQVAKLQAAKEEADAKQGRMKKEMKEEMERLKTQFIFKQHEFETSVRKPPLSVRSKKIAKDLPPTPVRMPSQIRAWNQGSTDGSGPSRFGGETPGRPQFNAHILESPTAHRAPRSPEKARKSAMLPGFQNSFINSSPVHPPHARSDKGRKGASDMWNESEKGKEAEESPFPAYPAHFTNSDPPPMSPPCSSTWVEQQTHDVDIRMEGVAAAARDEDRIVDIDFTRDVVPEDPDVEMINEEEYGPSPEELDQIEAPDWTQELCRIILTHTLPLCATSTFQILMRASLATSLPAASVETHSAACSQILEIIVPTSKYADYEFALESVSRSLVSMIPILNNPNSIPPLIALVNLLTILIYSLPTFSSALLSHTQKDSDRPRVLVLLCEILRDQPEYSKIPNKKDGLTTEIINFLEALCWNIPDRLLGKLAVIPYSREVMSTLLHNSQQSWFLAHSARLLANLATHPKLFRPLLSLPDPDLPPEEKSTVDFTRIHHIERLCSYLIDTSRQDAEAQSMRTSILAFFAMLSISHMDALSILIESLVLIPTLVVFLTHLTTPVWEDDEKLMSSSETIASSIRTLNQTLFLLHHLVFSADPVLNLRHKLHHAPHRPFNGITHMFIVTFGRLSYADPPEWVNHQQKFELELMSEMARDLLDLVVEGPESDSIWAAYQGEPEQGNDTDEEEMEAKLLGADEV